MSITYNGKSVLAIYRNGTAVEQALIAWNWTPTQSYFGGVRGAAYVPDPADVYGPSGLAAFGENISSVLDEKNGTPVLGPNLVVNGDFALGTGWSLPASYTISGQAMLISGNVSGYATQNIGLVAGRTYRVTFQITSRVSGGVNFLLGDTGSFSPTFNAVGSYSFHARAAGNALLYINGSPGGSANFSIDNISVREIPGNLAVQASTSPRPLLGRAPILKRNLIPYSEDFTNGWAWIGGQKTNVIPNLEMAPDGNMTADLIYGDVAKYTSLGAAISVPYVTGEAWTYSIYAKKQPGSPYGFLRLNLDRSGSNNGCVIVDLSNGSRTLYDNGDGSAAAVVDVGNGWYRISHTRNSVAASGSWISNNVRFFAQKTSAINENLSNGDGLSTSGVYVWGAQLERGSVATPYQKVTTNLDITESGVTSYPFIRMDLSDDALTTTGLGSTKNLLRYTEEFENAAWTKTNVTVPATQYAAPDETTTAERIFGTTGATSPSAGFQALGFTNGVTYTYTLYAKADGYNFLLMSLSDTGFPTSSRVAVFNLSAGNVGAATQVGLTATMQPVGSSGWYRCRVTQTADETTASSGFVSFGPRPADEISGTAANGTSGIFVWGAQLEKSSIPTDYEYSGFKGTSLVAGRNGTAVESITLPDGNFTLGPTAVTSGTPGLLRAVGDIVGYNLINKTLTPKERKYLIEYYKDRGAKGMLVSNGPELITNGSFDYDADWTKAGSTTIQGGAAVIVNGSGSSLTQDPPGLIFGKWYLLTTVISGLVSGNVIVRTVSSGGGISATPTYTTNGTFSAVVYAGIATGTDPLINVLVGGSTTCNIDSISCKELRPEEEWV